MPQRVEAATLFDLSEFFPDGFAYQRDFLSKEEEQSLLQHVARLSFADVRMHGVVARRRVAHFGFDYSYDSAHLGVGQTIPEFLLPLRERAATFASVRPDALAEVLVTQYPPGAPIGWHRDAPQFCIIVGVSLLSSCTFKLRPIDGTGHNLALDLEPRSVYLLSGAARSDWQHHIPPTPALRYSITFRTLRRQAGAPRPA